VGDDDALDELNLHLSTHVHNSLLAMAKARGMSVDKLVEQLVRADLDRRNPARD